MTTLNRLFFTLLAVIFVLAFSVNTSFAEELSDQEQVEDGEHEKKPEYAYFEMKGITIPYIREDGVTQFSTYLITLEVEKENEKKIEGKVRQLTDAYISYLFRLSQYNIDNRLRNLDFIKERLREVTEKVVDEDLIHDILIRGARDKRF